MLVRVVVRHKPKQADKRLMLAFENVQFLIGVKPEQLPKVVPIRPILTPLRLDPTCHVIPQMQLGNHTDENLQRELVKRLRLKSLNVLVRRQKEVVSVTVFQELSNVVIDAFSYHEATESGLNFGYASVTVLFVLIHAFAGTVHAPCGLYTNRGGAFFLLASKGVDEISIGHQLFRLNQVFRLRHSDFVLIPQALLIRVIPDHVKPILICNDLEVQSKHCKNCGRQGFLVFWEVHHAIVVKS
jgi:hypothetical protein